MSEFSLIDLIHQYVTVSRADVVLGSGDDCALLSPPAGRLLAISTDTLVCGRHFPEDTPAHAIGYKSLAVNLSDLAAMGARPAWCSLALTLPENNLPWLEDFSKGFAELAQQHNIQLTGGDTTRGPLSITVTVIGFKSEHSLARNQACDGDDIYVSGCLGQAAKELAHWGRMKADALNYPVPRVGLGLALADLAHAAIDISDGLLADLGHICQQSGLGARVLLEDVPMAGQALDETIQQRHYRGLCGGDDYELCFTASVEKREAIQALASQLAVPLTRVGSMLK